MKLSAWLTAAMCAGVCGMGLAQGPYKVLDQWKIGGTGGWDYLLADPTAHLLYVTHGPRVEVIDTKTGKTTGAITGLKGTHGIALDDAGKYGYVSDGRANQVVVFDRKTFATVTTVDVGTNPDGILWEPVTKTVWAFNGQSKNASVVDSATNKVLSTIDVPGKPEFPAADGKGFVYANIETANEIVKFDAKTRMLTATWKLTDCESPSGLAIDAAHHHLFAVCDGKKMAVVDTETGKQLASPSIGDGPDAAGYSIAKNVAFSSNGGGTLSVIDGKTYAVVQTLPTARGARTMAYDEGVDRVYLVMAEYVPQAAGVKGRPAVVPDSFAVMVVGR